MLDNINIKEISYGTSDYHRELILRDRLLRQPLGLDLFTENLEGEQADLHIGAFLDGILVGALVLTLTEEGVFQMRQVAVEPAHQNKQVGTKMVAFAEELVRKQGCSSIVVHARETAVPFYEKRGYQLQEEGFLEVGIPHRLMTKPV